MTFDIDLDKLPGYVWLRTAGRAEIGGFAKMLDALLGAAHWRPGAGLLVDHRRLVMEMLTADDMNAIERLIAERSAKLGTGHCALVLDGPFQFATGRAYAQRMTERGIHASARCFESPTPAATWLEVR